jgi:hypothetical protein
LYCCPPTVGVTIESVYVRAVLYCCPATVGVTIESVYVRAVLCCCPPTVGVTIESVYIQAVLYWCRPTVGVTPTPMIDCSTDSNHIYLLTYWIYWLLFNIKRAIMSTILMTRRCALP